VSEPPYIATTEFRDQYARARIKSPAELRMSALGGLCCKTLFGVTSAIF
jgi:hypothetical protein